MVVVGGCSDRYCKSELEWKRVYIAQCFFPILCNLLLLQAKCIMRDSGNCRGSRLLDVIGFGSGSCVPRAVQSEHSSDVAQLI